MRWHGKLCALIYQLLSFNLNKVKASAKGAFFVCIDLSVSQPLRGSLQIQRTFQQFASRERIGCGALLLHSFGKRDARLFSGFLMLAKLALCRTDSIQKTLSVCRRIKFLLSRA